MTAQLVDSKGRGHDVEAATIWEPIGGAWRIQGVTAGDGELLSGACVFRYGGAEWHGVIVDDKSGVWGERFSFFLLGGAGSWGRRLPAKGYHSDSGVRPSQVIRDAATECGETVGTLDCVDSLGVDYARPMGENSTAAMVLDDAAGSSRYWWVDRAGATNVGVRASSSWRGVIDWDPRAKQATLEADELSKLAVGVTLVDERIGSSPVVRELVIRLQGTEVRAFGWCGEGARMGRLTRALRSIVGRHSGGKLYGCYRYRVVSMGSDKRVNLRAVRNGSGVPDVLPVKMWPGLAGSEVTLTSGAEVLVEFEEGNRGKPFVSHFTPVGGGGFVPVSVALCGGTRPAAAVGSGVTIFMTPGTPVAVTGTVGGAPFAGTAVFAAPLRGVISDGTPLVRIP